MKIPIDWLRQGPARVRFRTRIDLLGEKETAPAAILDRKEMLRDGQIIGLLDSLGGWPDPPIKKQKQADCPPPCVPPIFEENGGTVFFRVAVLTKV
jgi:hypothetical protein